MSPSSTATPSEQTLYAALELSKNSWLLAIQFPERDKPSLHPIKGGDTDGLMAKRDAARERLAKLSARFLEQRGIDCRVMDPASLQVDRRARRTKTDRIDVEKLLDTLIAWCRGERHVCSMVVIPSGDEEDLRRSHRERDRLVGERTAHINRIKGLLFAQGIRGINVKRSYKTLTPADLVTGDGRARPRDRARDRQTGPGPGAASRD
jgi:transposase